jgi:hypothetical protein
MLVQIPYSIDEIVATLQFLVRRRRAGRPLLHVLLFGDTDEATDAGASRADARRGEGPRDDAPRDDGPRGAWAMLRHGWIGGVNLPWNLALAIAVGVWLMCSRLVLDAQGTLAHAHHLVGSIAVTVAVIACAEVARTLRFALVPLGLALCAAALPWSDGALQLGATLACGVALVLLGLPRGRVDGRYGGWNRYVL